jgi:hypothetical protein
MLGRRVDDDRANRLIGFVTDHLTLIVGGNLFNRDGGNLQAVVFHRAIMGRVIQGRP